MFSAKKLMASIVCLVLTLTMALVTMPQPTEAGYDKYKHVLVVVHYYDAAGDFCEYTRHWSKVPIVTTHYEKCHATSSGGRNAHECEDEHPHGYTEAFEETTAISVTVPGRDCAPYGNV